MTTIRLRLVLCLSILFPTALLAQETKAQAFNQQLTFTCDNNFLLFNGEDGYYTSGLFLKYDRLRSKTWQGAAKQIFSFEAGQQIYTAHSRKILPNPTQQFPGGLDEIDRPIAGYLYGKASLNTVFKNHKFLSLGISVGSIGQNSLGRETYAFWHRVIGVKAHWNWVWDHQVEDKLGLNLHGAFATPLLAEARRLQITPITESTLGTSFIDFTQAMLFQYGRLLSIANSSYWHTKLQASADKGSRMHELFFYYKPSLSYQLYNATIEGGRFNEQQGISLSPEPFVFSHEVGLRFSTTRYCLAYQFVLQSKEAKSQFRNQAYGSLVLAFRFGRAING
jgi:lipid A 3-O-deacylase